MLAPHPQARACSLTHTPVQGWANQAQILRAKYDDVSLMDRIPQVRRVCTAVGKDARRDSPGLVPGLLRPGSIRRWPPAPLSSALRRAPPGPGPQAMWRGRTKDKIYPHRDRLRWVARGPWRPRGCERVACAAGLRDHEHPARLLCMRWVPPRPAPDASACQALARMRRRSSIRPAHAARAVPPRPRRRKFVECASGAPPGERALVSPGPQPPVALQDNCDYRWGHVWGMVRTREEELGGSSCG